MLRCAEICGLITCSFLFVAQFKFAALYGVSVRIIKARNLVAADKLGKSDPFCVVAVDGVTKKTKVISKTLKCALYYTRTD